MGKIAQIQHILGVTEDDIWGPESKLALDGLVRGEKPVVLTGGVDARSAKNIETLHPKVRPLATALLIEAHNIGLNFVITSGSRTYEEQAVLRVKYINGGPKAARPGYSNHNFGLAFDVTEFRGPEPVWESPNYRKVGTIGKKLGLFWGGDWKGGDTDEPHFEFRPAWAQNMSETAMINELRGRTALGRPIV